MRIVADENIPMVDEYFGNHGDILRLPGREIRGSDLISADMLLVRSVTQVNESLLRGSPVKFVGSATIGEDHIDKVYLQDQGIGYANAPGANANSVVEYVCAAIIEWCEKGGRELESLSLGVVGVGSIGSGLARVAKALGMTVHCYDPPKGMGVAGQVPKAVIQADVVSIHTPLVFQGGSPTFHMVGRDFLNGMVGGQLLINSSRGAVVDNQALLDFLTLNPKHLDLVLDVWENEPKINLALLDAVFLATPHIAGYSFDGKVLATQMLQQASRSYGLMSGTPSRDQCGGEELQAFTLPEAVSFSKGLSLAVAKAFDIWADDMKMRRLASQSNYPSVFDGYRRNYPRRKEFNAYQFNFCAGQERLAEALAVLGFHSVRLGS